MCHFTYICSAQSENLRNLEIALRILRIPRLRTIVARSRDCATIVRNLLPRRACRAHYAFIQNLMTSHGYAGGINFEVCV